MAKESIYGFQSSDTANKLSSFAAQLGGSKSGSTLQNFSTSSFQIAYGEATATITAASGDNLGTGTVKVENWDVNATTVTRSQPSEAQSLTVFNTEEESFSTGDTVLVFKVASSYIVFAPPTATSGSGATGYGTLSSSLSSTDATASISLDSSSPLDPGASITATNWVGMDGSSGAKCIVSKTGTEYILIQLACPDTEEETP